MDCFYTLAPGVAWRLLDGEAVAYVGDRFETHLLDPASAGLIEVLQASSGPYSLLDIAQRFFSDDTPAQRQGSDSAADVSLLYPVLNQLEQLGILTRSLC